MFKFELGARCVDRVTGYVGQVVSRADYVGGVNRYGIQGVLNEDGSVPTEQWVDEGRLEQVAAETELT